MAEKIEFSKDTLIWHKALTVCPELKALMEEEVSGGIRGSSCEDIALKTSYRNYPVEALYCHKIVEEAK